MTEYKNYLYFTADTDSGNKLHRTDGFPDGTSIFYDSYPEPGFDSPKNFIVYHDYLYFTAQQGLNSKLFRSDGTVEGTGIVNSTSSFGGLPFSFTIHNDTLFFNTLNMLWKSDGKPYGTVKTSSPAMYVDHLVSYNNLLYMSGFDAVYNNELWVYNAATDTGSLALDINPGNKGSRIRYMITFGNWLYFQADNGVNGIELMKSNGTYVEVVKDICVGSCSSTPSNLFVYQNKFYFQANDGTNGFELWSSDGSAVGTVLVKSIRPGSGSGYPADFVVFKNILYFQANDGVNGYELWRSDGIIGGNGTYMEAEIVVGSGTSNINPNGDIYGIVAFKNALFMSGQGASTGHELWKYTPGQPKYYP